MSQSSQIPMPVQNSSAMIRTLTLVAVISAVLVVLAVDLTRARIAENQRIAVENAIFRVLPQAKQWQAYTLTQDALLPAMQDANGIAVYIGFDGNGMMTGMATEAAAQGYADTIRLLYGYNPACECITGIKVLRSVETPGLGDKIFKDADFLANFDALSARLNSQQSALEHAIVTVKHGRKTHPWEIDAISGATISSRAVGKAINDSAQALLPRLVEPLSQIQPIGSASP